MVTSACPVAALIFTVINNSLLEVALILITHNNAVVIVRFRANLIKNLYIQLNAKFKAYKLF
jgi:tricorn protease-like protein